MGGKPIKPKIQAYVEQQWFDEFEVYCSTHNLNQSKALEKILAEFFGGPSQTASLPDGLDTSALVDGLRAELAELKHELDQRLRLVESGLAIKSAFKSAVESAGCMAKLADESVDRLASGVDESAIESAIAQSESAIPLNELAAESATGLDGLVSESAVLLTDSATTPVSSLTESANKSATDSAIVEEANALLNIAPGEVGSAIASPGEDIPDLDTPSSEPVEAASVEERQNLEPLTTAKLAQRLRMNASQVSRTKDRSDEYFRKWTAARDPSGIAWEYRPESKPKFHPVVPVSLANTNCT